MCTAERCGRCSSSRRPSRTGYGFSLDSPPASRRLGSQRGKSLDGSQLELKENQKQALTALEEMCCNFETIALLYHATGTGKTVAAVMDAKRVGKRTWIRPVSTACPTPCTGCCV